MITGRTALYGVLGWPVDHTLSPAMQNAALAACGLDGAYVPLAVPPERLAVALAGAHALGFRGLNVTVPHKQAALDACARLDGGAMACGAVNTLVREEAGWAGFNTDAPALRELLVAAGIGAGSVTLVLGAGGAARAAVWALGAVGAEAVLASRRPEQARELQQEVGGRVKVADWSELADVTAQADCVLNATSAGLPGKEPLPELPLRARQIACDFVYGDTPFVRAARAAGARLVTGEAILVRQGALAFALWHGRPAPEPVMTAALAAASGAPTR